MRTNSLSKWLMLGAFAAAASMPTACNRSDGVNGHAHDGEGPHEHEEMTAQITIWTNGYEIFAEHKAPVAGKPTLFATHVTDLETLQPRSQGPVTFLVQQDGAAVIEHLQAAPARPGIYLPALTFPKPGQWQVHVVVENKSNHLGLVEVYADAAAAAHAEIPEAPEGISFLKEQQWRIASKSEPLTKRALIERVRVPATVAAKPGLLASVNAPIAGRVLPAEGKALPIIGDKVELGQTLALLQPSLSEMGVRMVEAEAEVTRARLALEQAELAFKRIEALGKAEARTQREVQEAEFARKNAEANFNAAQSLQATYRSVTAKLGGKTNSAQPLLELKAPIAGTLVSQISVAVGEYIPAERALFTILDARTVFIEGRISESDARRLSEGKGASYELPGERGTFQPILGEGKGRLVFAGIQVDAATRTLPLVYELPNTEGRLRIGEAITLHVETAHAENALAIPESAVVEEQGQPVAFVQVAGETFERRPLTLGIRDGAWVQVVAGLKENERVVTNGAYGIRLAAASSSLPAHGHAH